MPKKGVEYRFVISAYSPERMPLSRLAEYLVDLAYLFGEKEYVHFDRLIRGSTTAKVRVDHEAVPKVERRLYLVKSGEGDEQGMHAFDRLNNLLAEDNARGQIKNSVGAQLVKFPGIDLDRVAEAGPFNQNDELLGELVRIGGKGSNVPVHIKSSAHANRVYVCEASREIARQLAPYIFGPELRVSGRARWKRTARAEWELLNFTIKSFDPLKTTPLNELVKEIRNIGTGIDTVEDPIGTLDRIRNGEVPN